MIRNIIFDWSGTLVDDLPAVWAATNFVLVQAKCEPLTMDQFRAEFCLPFTRFYSRYVPHVPLPQLEDWFHGEFRRSQDSVRELPFARNFLEFCRERGLRLFVLSTVHPDHFKTQAETTGFGTFFERVYTGVHDKTQRISTLLLENQLAPTETLFIGDMQHDIETARHGGLHACAVLTGYNTLTQLRSANPDLVVEHLGELRRFLEDERNPWPLKKPHDSEALPVVTVGAVIANDSGQILLVRTHKWSDLWGIPGGKVKMGELSEDALRREIKEETNLDVSDIRFVMVQDCVFSKEFYRKAHFVLLNYYCRSLQPADVRLNHEAREYRWATIDEAFAMALNTPTRVLLNAVARPGFLPSPSPAP